MIISRTPFRISFFGGGTDYPAWYNEHEGAVLGTTFNKYCYITLRYLPPFFDHRSRIIYSKMEHVNGIDDIDHPAVREVLRFKKVTDGVEIHHDGDLPARTGLGSSSSFTVGLLHAVYAMQGKMVSKEQLAKEAIHIEQNMCKENVGCQDQVFAAYGGFNLIKFGGREHLDVTELAVHKDKVQHLEKCMMMFFTGFARNASDIAAAQVKNTPKKTKELKAMHKMVYQALKVLDGNRLDDFGRLLNDSWQLKRTLSDKITTPHIDEIYNSAMKAGALGGKLLGAGGGGFMLFYVPVEKQAAVKKKFAKLLQIPFHFESLGTRIIFYQPNGIT